MSSIKFCEKIVLKQRANLLCENNLLKIREQYLQYNVNIKK